MNKKYLPSAGVILPVTFWGIIVIFRWVVLRFSAPPEVLVFEFLTVLVGIVFFSRWVFGIIDKRDQETEVDSQQLKALHDAVLVLTAEHELPVVMQKIVDLSRALVKARYGALGVLDEKENQFSHYIISGLDKVTGADGDSLPNSKSVLGEMLREGIPLCVSNITEDEHTMRYPDLPAQMKSLICAPVILQGRVIGNIFLEEKLSSGGEKRRGVGAFNEQDQQVLNMFATQAAIVIENAQLYRERHQFAVLQERERFGMDLHDGIIQSIYAIGLMLEDTQNRIGIEPEQTFGRITRAIYDLNDVIRDLRNYILDLRPHRFQGRDLHQGLDDLVRELQANTFLNVEVHNGCQDGRQIPPEKTVEILHIAQEALVNVRKHSRASKIDIELNCEGAVLDLRISDNGIGIFEGSMESSLGNGIRNMRERATALGGEFTFENRKGGGAQVILQIPFVSDYVDLAA